MRSADRLWLLGLAVLGWALAMIMSACPAATPVAPGCGKDTDCRDGRICAAGRCADRPPAVRDGGLAVIDAAPVARPGAPPFAMFKGDARHRGLGAGPAPAKQPAEVWRYKTGGPVVGSATLGPDGTVYVASHDGSLYALGDGGAVKWSFKTGDRVWSTPAVASDGTVYVGSDDDNLYAVEGATGKEKWRYRIGACADPMGFGPEGVRCDADGGPTLGPDGTIYLGGDGVYAVWPDGTLRWKLATAEHVAAAPALAADGTVYAACEDDALYAVRPDGTKAWELRTTDDLDAAPAIGDDGTIYLGGDDHAVYAVAPDGTVKWKVVTGADVRASPSIGPDGTIYVGSYDHDLYALSPAGAVKWRFSTADKIHGAATIASNGVILFGSEDDHLYALSPDGQLLWYVALDGDVDAAPIVGQDGAIYLGADDGVVRNLR